MWIFKCSICCCVNIYVEDEGRKRKDSTICWANTIEKRGREGKGEMKDRMLFVSIIRIIILWIER